MHHWSFFCHWRFVEQHDVRIIVTEKLIMSDIADTCSCAVTTQEHFSACGLFFWSRELLRKDIGWVWKLYRVRSGHCLEFSPHHLWKSCFFFHILFCGTEETMHSKGKYIESKEGFLTQVSNWNKLKLIVTKKRSKYRICAQGQQQNNSLDYTLIIYFLRFNKLMRS